MVAAGTLVADGGVGTIEAVYDVDLDQTVVTATDVTPQGDISGDGSVDLTDFAMLAAEWLTGVE
jgi:phage gp45-like